MTDVISTDTITNTPLPTIQQHIHTPGVVRNAILTADARFKLLSEIEIAEISSVIFKYVDDPKTMHDSIMHSDIPRYDEYKGELWFVDHLMAILGYALK